MSIAIEEFLAGAAQQLLQQQQSQAQQVTLDTVLAAVNATLTQINVVLGDLANGVYGLAALHSQLATFQATTAIDFTAVLTAIAATQQTGSPVTLPATYPGGWSAGIGADSANGVWNTVDAYTGATTLGDLSNLAVVSINQGAFHTNPGDNGEPFVWIDNLFQTVPLPIGRTFGAKFPANNILSTDTLLTFLNTANPGWTWYWDDLSHTWATATDPANGTTQWYCEIDAVAFAEIQRSMFSTAALPPVWPGLSGVTIGSPTAIATGVTVVGPMAGVIIQITAVPAKQGQFNFDTAISWRNIGALSFYDDNGEQEFPQTLGFEDCVYLPKSMVVAAGIRLRASAGVAGTITPFTIP